MTTGIKKVKESKFQTSVIHYVRSRGGYIDKIHVSSYQSQGVPDLQGCYLGMFIAFETKTPKGRASELQKQKQHEIQVAGGVSEFVRTLKEVEDILDEIFRIRQDNKS